MGSELVEFAEKRARLLAAARKRSLTVCGLFAGVGGLELGFQRAGHHANLLCEIEPGAMAVLEERFPKTKRHKDVCTLGSLPKDTDLLAGGFPCQDLSQAGKTVGIEGSRSGLVGEVFRLLRRKRVPWVLLENVPFMLQLSRGRAMEVIVTTLESLGYKWAYRVVNTLAFGLPQRRERVFLLASREEDPRRILFADDVGDPVERKATSKLACGFYWTEGMRGLGWAVDAVPTLKGGSTIGIPSPPAIVMPNGAIVTPDLRDAERMQGFASDWTQPSENITRASHRWKLVGNAITVDVAEWVAERLLIPGDQDEWNGTPITNTSRWPRAAWNVGKGRYSIELSAWPVRRRGQHLHEFLRFAPRPLSEKATAGFLGRALQAKLRFPDRFLIQVSAHLAKVRDLASQAEQPAWA